MAMIVSKRTTCRWYGPPLSVLVVLALAMFWEMTSIRTFSACKAEAALSAPGKMLMFINSGLGKGYRVLMAARSLENVPLIICVCM